MTMPKERKKVEDYYPITRITYPGGDTSMDLVLDEHLKNFTPPKDWLSLESTLIGQTRAIEGVYAADVQKWLDGQPVVD
jgi:hypothetical protein